MKSGHLLKNRGIEINQKVAVVSMPFIKNPNLCQNNYTNTFHCSLKKRTYESRKYKRRRASCHQTVTPPKPIHYITKQNAWFPPYLNISSHLSPSQPPAIPFLHT